EVHGDSGAATTQERQSAEAQERHAAGLRNCGDEVVRESEVVGATSGVVPAFELEEVDAGRATVQGEGDVGAGEDQHAVLINVQRAVGEHLNAHARRLPGSPRAGR